MGLQNMIPYRLQKGDTVGIVSPSAPITQDLMIRFEKGIKVLQNFGLKVKHGQHIFDRYYYSAGTRKARIEDFNAIWKSPEVKMILMSQGGGTANNLLDAIDYDYIRENPKIFAGISDGTTLLNAIYAKTGLVTYHGIDLLWTFGRDMTETYRENFFRTLFEGKVGSLMEDKNWAHMERKDLNYTGWNCIRRGNAAGTLIGGHSGALSRLMLAGYAPDLNGAILFLEGTDNIASLDNQFTTLRLNGVFNKLNGLILGWFEGRELKNKNENREIRDLILEITDGYSFPILEIGELGHNVENYILPIGCKATIDSERKYLSIDEPTVF